MPWSRMVSLELDDEEKLDAFCPPIMAKGPDYPPGLCICLTGRELEKLDLEADCEIGDMIDIRCFARVTSVSKRAGADAGDDDCRVELQITDMALENEMTEDEDDDDD